jgi:hypothetical protein
MTLLAGVGKKLGDPLEVFIAVAADSQDSELREKIIGGRFHNLGAGPRRPVRLDANGQYVLVE